MWYDEYILQGAQYYGSPDPLNCCVFWGKLVTELFYGKELIPWCHRENDLPAKIFWGGDKQWWINNELHRENGPAWIAANGVELWYLNGKSHRIGGPALSYPNEQRWCKNGQMHRDDGPAIISKKEKEFWINHVDITDKVNAWIAEHNYPIWKNENSWNDAIKIHFKMTFDL